MKQSWFKGGFGLLLKPCGWSLAPWGAPHCRAHSPPSCMIPAGLLCPCLQEWVVAQVPQPRFGDLERAGKPHEVRVWDGGQVGGTR